jgi:alpha-tubulin suppressor-like RCC1 family protein
VSFAAISAGDTHSCGLSVSGQIYCWGENFNSELGTGSNASSDAPAPVSSGLTFKVVRVGDRHSCAISTADDGYCWGLNDKGQLGDASTSTRSVPTLLAGGMKWASISVGGRVTCGITLSGRTYCWGDNVWGQLGSGTANNNIPQPTEVSGTLGFSMVSAGDQHVCAITTAHVTYCWGLNNAGQLGDGTTTNRNVPVVVGAT